MAEVTNTVRLEACQFEIRSVRKLAVLSAKMSKQGTVGYEGPSQGGMRKFHPGEIGWLLKPWLCNLIGSPTGFKPKCGQAVREQPHESRMSLSQRFLDRAIQEPETVRYRSRTAEFLSQDGILILMDTEGGSFSHLFVEVVLLSDKRKIRHQYLPPYLAGSLYASHRALGGSTL